MSDRGMHPLVATPFILLFGALSLVYLLSPIYAPAMAAELEPERFAWLVEGYPAHVLADDPELAESLEDAGDIVFTVYMCSLMAFLPLTLWAFFRLLWIPAIWLWGELEDQVAAGFLGFVRVCVSALLPFLIALGFACGLGGSWQGAIAYGGCTLFLAQVTCVLIGMTATQLIQPNKLGLVRVAGYWLVAIPVCMPAYLSIFVLEPSPWWWLVEHLAMGAEVVILWRVLGGDHEGRTIFQLEG